MINLSLFPPPPLLLLREIYHQLRFKRKDIQDWLSEHDTDTMSSGYAFCLTNAPAGIMDLMNRVDAYLDKVCDCVHRDISFTPATRKKHEEHLKTILDLPEEEELYANFSKCSTTTLLRDSQFLGLAGFYRRFMKDFSKIASILTELYSEKLCVAPILALPEGSDDFVVYCDASIKGLGALCADATD
ncbi:hypothetical protein Tco_0211840 [Tanacetum coccineum]